MKLYGLLGKKLSHSFSSNFFNAYFLENQIAAEYKNFELKQIDDVSNVFELKPQGLNVTIPYKEKIIPYLDDLDEVAHKIRAVNTICFDGTRKIGRNTDVVGFKRMIQPFLTSKHERAVIFGTGGASKAVAYVLEQIGIDVVFISRKPCRERNIFSYSDINENMLRSCKLLINTTPVGMYPKEMEVIKLPFTELNEEHLVVDLIYNPEQTLFLKRARENGAEVLNGSSMLKEQALESWRLWN